MNHTSNPVLWEQGAHSHPGGRSEQQDRWGLFPAPEGHGLLAVVADGMGGHQDGALGAQIVVDTAQRFVAHPPPTLHQQPLAALEQLCLQMHGEINQRAENARSTLVMVWLRAAHAYWLSIGDSRLYHFRNGQRIMRTRDHSAVQLLMDLGEIKEADMATHPAQNRLYRCLGGDETPKPDRGDFVIRAGDLLAMCSDGVWEHVAEAEFWDETAKHGTEDAARFLASEAARRGGRSADNTTLVLLRATAAHLDQPSLAQRLAAGLGALFGRGAR